MNKLEPKMKDAQDEEVSADKTAESHNLSSEDLSEHKKELPILNQISNTVFLERLEAYKKQLNQEMMINDVLDMRIPQCVSEIANDIFREMRNQELVFQVDADYLSKV